MIVSDFLILAFFYLSPVALIAVITLSIISIIAIVKNCFFEKKLDNTKYVDYLGGDKNDGD